MKDFSAWEEYEEGTEGSGRSEKIWLQDTDTGQVGLFKFKKDTGTTDHVSECIACQIAQKLELPCAKFELGTYEGREGPMSYNIIDTEEAILIEGINFITQVYPEYNDEKFIDPASEHRYSIEMVQEVTKAYVSIEEFLKMLMFDFLIGNTDRHQSNWALISKNNKMEWSPLYDNSSSLCSYISEEQISNYLGKDKNRWRALVDTKSRSMIRCRMSDEKRQTHLMILQYIRDNYYDETYDFARKIVQEMTESNIDYILKQYSESELSGNKKELIFHFLCSKVELLKEVYWGKEEADVC